MGTPAFGINYKKVFTGSDVALPAGVGQRGMNNKGEFIFVKANGTIAQYAAVGVDKDGLAVELTTTNYATSAVIGFAQVAAVANDYFWLWVGFGGGANSGIKGKVLASYVAYAVMNTSATAGSVDDAATKIIGGVVGVTTDGGAGSSIELMASGPIIKVTA